MTTIPTDDIVVLATAPNPAQAHLWEQELRADGIDCRVVGDYLDAGLGDIPGLRAEIWVRRDDLRRAQEILRTLEEGPARAGGAEPPTETPE